MKKALLFTVVILSLLLSGCFGRTEYTELSSLGSMDISDEDVVTSDTTTQSIDATQKTSGTTARRDEDKSSVDNEVDLDAFFGTTTTKTTKKTMTTEQKETVSPSATTSQITITPPSTEEEKKPTSGTKLQLPAVGYDPDGKGRVKVKAVSVSDYTVSIELENVSAKWMTEETTLMECTCYDQNGTVLKKEQVAVGVIESSEKKSVQLQISADTAKVEITGFKTAYWTQWK